MAVADFNGKGTGDLAIGAPNRDLPNLPDAGGIVVLFGQLLVNGFEIGSVDESSGAAL